MNKKFNLLLLLSVLLVGCQNHVEKNQRISTQEQSDQVLKRKNLKSVIGLLVDYGAAIDKAAFAVLQRIQDDYMKHEVLQRIESFKQDFNPSNIASVFVDILDPVFDVADAEALLAFFRSETWGKYLRCQSVVNPVASNVELAKNVDMSKKIDSKVQKLARFVKITECNDEIAEKTYKNLISVVADKQKSEPHLRYIMQVMKSPSFIRFKAQLYSKCLSESDADRLLAFFESKTGKKYLQNFDKITFINIEMSKKLAYIIMGSLGNLPKLH